MIIKKGKLRALENDVNVRDKVITELRLRMPATNDRDLLIKSAMSDSNSMTSDLNTPVRAAQATIESLQGRLKQKDMTVAKYQEMLKLARDELNQANKQHELEINNMIDKLNLTRDTNLQKLKQELKHSSSPNTQVLTMSKTQLNRLQELEEVTIEQENTISGLQQKIKKLNTELDTWKARNEMQSQKSVADLAQFQSEKAKIAEKLNKQIDEFRVEMNGKQAEIENIKNQLEKQKELNAKSPTNEVKSVVEKLKQQLLQKEEQQKALNQVLLDLKSDMVTMAKNNLVSFNDESNQEKKIQNIIEKTSADYQDKLYTLSEEMAKIKKDLKQKTKANEELNLELDHVKAQLSW